MNDVVTLDVVVRLQKLWFPQEDMCRWTEVMPATNAVGMCLPARPMGLRGSSHRMMLYCQER